MPASTTAVSSPELASSVRRMRRLAHAGLGAAFLVGAGAGWDAVAAAALFAVGWATGSRRLGLPLWAQLGYDLLAGVGLWWLFGPVSGAEFIPFAVVAIGAVLLDPVRGRWLLAGALATVPTQIGLHFLGEAVALPLFHDPDPIPVAAFIAASATQAGILAAVGGVMLVIARLLRAGRAALAADLERERELNQMKDRFIATVSHELRTPLTALRGFTSTLLEGDPDDEERREFLLVMRDQAEELTSLIEDLITFSWIEAGRLTMEPAPLSVKDEVDRVVSGFGVRGAEVQVRVRSSLVVWADPVRLRQMLRNLVDNALKYGVPPVLVGAEPCGEEVALRVLDHGDGLDPSQVEAAFAPYGRLVDDHTMSRPGLGLGLTLVRQLATAHGGSVRTVEVGELAGIEVRLPAARPVSPMAVR